MTEWDQVARLLGVEAPPEVLKREMAPLGPLEAALQPMIAKLTPDDEPAVLFTPLVENESR